MTGFGTRDRGSRREVKVRVLERERERDRERRREVKVRVLEREIGRGEGKVRINVEH